MARVLFIIAQKNFRDEELLHPKKILEDGGYQCDIASITREPAVGMLGAQVKPDLAVKEAKIDDYDAVIVVGGSGSPTLAEHEEVLRLLQEAAANKKIIGAICLGPMVLARAGVLAGKKATIWCSPSKKEVSYLEDGGAQFVEQDVVQDGNIITANGPHAANEFGKTILKALGG